MQRDATAVAMVGPNAGRRHGAGMARVEESAARPLREELDILHDACQALSEKHRLSVPPEMVQDRLHDLSQAAADLFQERVIQICFLLDQFGTLRFNELRRAAGNPSTRTLAAKLAFLQAEGIISRRLYDQMPPRVDYVLTPRGKRLTDFLFPALLHAADREGLEVNP